MNDLNGLIKGYIIFVSVVMLLYCSIRGPLPWGEYDDYTLPVASLLNDGNFSITESDIEYYKKLFPEQTGIDLHSLNELSNYLVKDGEGMMTWYFPTYAIISMPMVLLLNWLDLPASYGFVYTNILLLVLLLVFVYKYLRASLPQKALVILALSINPIVFYMPWMMAEVTIFVFLGMAMVAWYNNWYKRAAIFLSIAGTLNVTVMVSGFLMIFEYLFKMIINRPKEEKLFRYMKKNFLSVFVYGCCYVISLVPMMYNYYNMGAINLTASYSSFTMGRESTLERFRAYFIDLNYGYLPYYGVLLCLGFVLFVIAIKKKHLRYIEMIVAFLGNVCAYSIMTHINCGGSGIARYSAWCAVILVLAVVLYYDELVTGRIAVRTSQAMIGINCTILACIIFSYGPYAASNTWSTGLRPITKYVLDHYPGIYNPLKSSFYAEINNVLGGYDYTTPVVYADDDGHVRKILATAYDQDRLLSEYGIVAGDENWLEAKVQALGDREGYISVPKDIKVMKNASYIPGTDIIFRTEGNTAQKYINAGIYHSEEWGSWSAGTAVLSMRFPESNVQGYRAQIECGVYNNEQQVLIYVNDQLVYDRLVRENEGIVFDFDKPVGLCEIRIELPYATENAPNDGRILGLSIGRITIEENRA